jgi:hypothetical protein
LVSNVLGNVPVKRWSERIQDIYLFGGVALTVVAVVFVVASFWGLFREALAIDVLWCAQSLLFLRFEFPSWRDERESFLGPLLHAICGVAMAFAGFLNILVEADVLSILVIVLAGLLTVFSVDHCLKLKGRR